MLKRTITIMEDDDMVEKMNNFFASVSNTKNNKEISKPVLLFPCNIDCVFPEMRMTKKNPRSGAKNEYFTIRHQALLVQLRVLQEFKYRVVTFLIKMCTLSLKRDTVPEDLKKAYAGPIF